MLRNVSNFKTPNFLSKTTLLNHAKLGRIFGGSIINQRHQFKKFQGKVDDSIKNQNYECIVEGLVLDFSLNFF